MMLFSIIFLTSNLFIIVFPVLLPSATEIVGHGICNVRENECAPEMSDHRQSAHLIIIIITKCDLANTIANVP